MGGKDLSPEPPAKGVTEPTGPSELKTRLVLGNLQEAVLADSRPWATFQGLARMGSVRRRRVLKEGQGPMSFADRCCKGTWRRHRKCKNKGSHMRKQSPRPAKQRVTDPAVHIE